jgi:TRAP-type C4-dicarboxylate transport system permease small subunit
VKTVGRILDNSEEIFAGFFLISTVALLFVQVVLRYFFGRSLAWTEELSRYAFLWMVYIGTSLAAKYDGHIRVTAQLNLVPRQFRRYVLVLADLLWLTFNGYVIIEGIQLLGSMGQYRLVSGAMGWDMRIVFAILPIAFIAQSIRIMQVMYKRLRGQWQDSFETEANL